MPIQKQPSAAQETPVTSGRRSYHSPLRQRRAEENRRRILAAARTLFAEQGYARTTLEAIAEQAGVSPKTVVAAFASKRGILAEALNPDALDSPYQEALERLRTEDVPRRRLALAAALARQVYGASGGALELLFGGRAIAPELAEIAQLSEQRRRSAQERLIVFLAERDALRPGLSREQAIDELLALTSFDLYQTLVRSCGWAPERYEAWLADLLAQRLLTP